MKKLGLIIAMALFMVSFAYASPTVVNGIVYSGSDIDSPVVVGATVNVSCNGYDVSGPTDSKGKYFLLFKDGLCPADKTATACVGDVCNSGTGEELGDLDIFGVDIFNVPEFSLIAGLTALAGSLIAFFVIRRK